MGQTSGHPKKTDKRSAPLWLGFLLSGIILLLIAGVFLLVLLRKDSTDNGKKTADVPTTETAQAAAPTEKNTNGNDQTSADQKEPLTKDPAEPATVTEKPAEEPAVSITENPTGEPAADTRADRNADTRADRDANTGADRRTHARTDHGTGFLPVRGKDGFDRFKDNQRQKTRHQR